jgi:hypothetical protein
MTLKKMNIATAEIEPEVLWQILDLDVRAGRLVWRTRPVDHFPDGKPTPEKRAAMWNGKYAGKPAFTSQDPRGYYRGEIGGIAVYAHRVIRAMIDGAWPDGEVDHINRIKSDNRPENLRVVTHAENRANTECSDQFKIKMAAKKQRAEQRAKKYPVPGVRRQSRKSWSARVKVNGKDVHLGSFACFGAAVRARGAV